MGAKLLQKNLEHAERVGLEKIELSVYNSNIAAVQLYKRFGFETEGILRNYRQLDGQIFDCLATTIHLKNRKESVKVFCIETEAMIVIVLVDG